MINGNRQEQIAALEKVVGALLAGRTHSEAHLTEMVEQYRRVAAPDATDEDVAALVRRLTERLSIDVEQGVAIVGEDFKPWLQDKKRQMDWSRWLNFKQWMLNDGRPPRVIDKMDDLTDEILDFAGDPTAAGPWARRGLVIGEVQSGKTSTYLALFNKAVDAGYRLIIVLAGNTESLRQQTQERVDEGLIGRDTSLSVARPGIPAQTRYIGVGALDSRLANAQGMTTVIQDFRTSSLAASNITVGTDSAEPYVFVVKKNKAVLETLTEWLGRQRKVGGKLTLPLLLLDDESDYASVNTREDHNPTTINSGIRGILDLFSRSSYVAFTATPFANIFIDHEVENDLFPRHYIYGLESPSNYVGSQATFGSLEEPSGAMLVELGDAEEFTPLGHRAHWNIGEVPESLREAIRTFFVANAVRDLRGQRAPRSMLVNVSRFKRVQSQVFDAVQDEVSTLRNEIEAHAAQYRMGHPNRTLDIVKETFERRYPDITETWEEVLDVLAAAAADIRVQLFNSDKDRVLGEEDEHWDRPQRMIAVGGDVLSRGLTLQGLTVSYFYRRVVASDTLMQMARWFGYRDGYKDICRVWIDKASASDYRHVADSVEELRRDLRLMLRQKLTPEDFGIAVKKHPGALLITAKNKMKAAETRSKTISLAGKRIETTKLSPEKKVISDNWSAFQRLGDAIAASTAARNVTGRWPRWSGVPKRVIADFLSQYQAHPSDAIFSASALSSFARHATAPEFQTWDVVVVNGSREQVPEEFAGVKFYPPRRTIDRGADKELRVSGTSSRLAGPTDVRVLLSNDDVEAAVADAGTDGKGKNPPETVFYSRLRRPAMLLYPLLPQHDKLPQGVDIDKIIVAVKLAIPGRAGDPKDSRGDVEYVINTVAQRKWFIEIDESEIADEVDD
ncbi:Z1 domain-containing protein [Micromonospora sp. NPDC049282]|uniref:Z1 domain-containing protein n=1 Tax=Micromonospora sp. NPDC049282 TaxID=3364269 RepID=UPI0037233BFE